MDKSAGAEEILTWLQVSRDFVSEQAPLLAQEVLNWGIASYLSCLVFSIIMASTSAMLARLFWRYYQMECDEDFFVVAVLSGLVCAGFTGATLWNLVGLIQVLVAPRLYLIEQLRNLIP